jgi:hypothetical protein
MKTSRLLIIITGAAILFAAPVASARPAHDPDNARPYEAQPATLARIAAHHEQVSQQQYLAGHRPSTAVPPTDDPDTPSPLVFALVGLSIPLGIGLATILAKPVRAHVLDRRPPANVA